uniref:Uncharacterized protein n=1 Tax=Arundo donax TaxID=35708 RepID=A0A0A8YJ54_ARUDO
MIIIFLILCNCLLPKDGFAICVSSCVLDIIYVQFAVQVTI